ACLHLGTLYSQCTSAMQGMQRRRETVQAKADLGMTIRQMAKEMGAEMYLISDVHGTVMQRLDEEVSAYRTWVQTLTLPQGQQGQLSAHTLLSHPYPTRLRACHSILSVLGWYAPAPAKIDPNAYHFPHIDPRDGRTGVKNGDGRCPVYHPWSLMSSLHSLCAHPSMGQVAGGILLSVTKVVTPLLEAWLYQGSFHSDWVSLTLPIIRQPVATESVVGQARRVERESAVLRALWQKRYRSEGAFGWWATAPTDVSRVMEDIMRQGWADQGIFTIGTSADGCGQYMSMASEREVTREMPVLGQCVWVGADSVGQWSYRGGSMRYNALSMWLGAMEETQMLEYMLDLAEGEGPGAMVQTSIDRGITYEGGWTADDYAALDSNVHSAAHTVMEAYMGPNPPPLRDSLIWIHALPDVDTGLGIVDRGWYTCNWPVTSVDTRVTLSAGVAPNGLVFRHTAASLIPTVGGHTFAYGTCGPWAQPDPVQIDIEGGGTLPTYSEVTFPASALTGGEEVDTHLIGQVRATLGVSIAADSGSAADIDLHLTLCEIDSEGGRVMIAQGVQRVGWRGEGEGLGFAMPAYGERVSVEVDMWHAVWHLSPGSTLSLLVAASNHPMYIQYGEDSNVTIDITSSWIDIPVVLDVTDSCEVVKLY
ncbi:hypothetical protein KIPB_001237, partial [Kipferlia bialata]